MNWVMNNTGGVRFSETITTYGKAIIIYEYKSAR
jgi:hypothetical protein